MLPYIDSNYELISRLGGGGTSNVYLIRHKFFDSDNERALKIIDTDYILKNNDENVQKYNEIKDRFIQEAKLYKRMNHENIVGIDNVGVVADKERGIEIPYIIMKYIKGETLKDKLSSKTPFDIEMIFKISKDVLSALQAIHNKNIIHRDIKSGNIIIEQGTGKAVLIDFGLAKDLLSKSNLTKTDQALGTLQYMSPEQFSHIKNVLPMTDVYSLGIVLYEMITGVVPYNGTPQEIMYAHFNNPIPKIKNMNLNALPELQTIIEKAMAKKPEDRYRSAMEFLSAIEKLERKYKIEKAKKQAEEERRKKEKQEAKKKAEEERKLKKELEAKKRAEKEERRKEEEDAKKRLEEERKRREEIQAKKQAEEERRKKEKVESKRRLEEEQKRKKEEDSKKRAAESALKAEQTSEAKPTRSKRKIVLTAAVIIAIAILLIIVITMDNGNGKKAMRNDFHALEIFLKGNANKEDKIARCRKFLQDHEKKANDNDTKSMITQTNGFIHRLQKEIADEDAKYERKNGKREYDRMIKGKIDLTGYQVFINKYPDSEFKGDLQKKFRAADKNLPLEIYWTKTLIKNSKSYYERTFANNHIMIYIPEKNFWIDKYEVSVEQFKNFDPNVNWYDNEPVIVSYIDAVDYCRHYGFRLPQKVEWEFAAGKARGFNYPWGNNAPDAGSIYRANFIGTRDGYSSFAPVNEFEEFSSLYGIANMAGNAWEWVDGQILKGGGISSSENELRIEYQGDPGYQVGGFRCIKEEK